MERDPVPPGVAKAQFNLDDTAICGFGPLLIFTTFKRMGAAPAAGSTSTFKVMDWLLAGSVGLATFVAQATMVVFLVYFLLLSGDTFKRKLVKLTGPSLSRKKVTVWYAFWGEAR